MWPRLQVRAGRPIDVGLRARAMRCERGSLGVVLPPSSRSQRVERNRDRRDGASPRRPPERRHRAATVRRRARAWWDRALQARHAGRRWAGCWIRVRPRLRNADVTPALGRCALCVLLSAAVQAPAWDGSVHSEIRTIMIPRSRRDRLNARLIEPRLLPQLQGERHRVDFDRLPPSGLVAPAVQLAMVDATERNRELIADLAAERARLGKTEVVRVRRGAAAHEAGLRWRRICSAPCRAIGCSLGGPDGRHLHLRVSTTGSAPTRLGQSVALSPTLVRRGRKRIGLGLVKPGQPLGKCALDRVRVGRCERVLDRQASVRPQGCFDRRSRGARFRRSAPPAFDWIAPRQERTLVQGALICSADSSITRLTCRFRSPTAARCRVLASAPRLARQGPARPGRPRRQCRPE